jgi:DNA repair exonuclease SbcCD ATPase subunit
MTTEPKRRALKWIGTRLSDHRAELVEVRDEVDSMRRAMDERIATAGKALTRLAAERGDLQRERDLLRQSLAEKSRVAARLRSELEQSRATNEELIAAATLPAAAQTSAQVVDDPTSPPEKSGFRHNLAMAGELRETRAELAALRIKLEDAEEDAARSSSRAALGSLPAQAETRALRGELDATRAELVAIKDAFAEAERSWT